MKTIDGTTHCALSPRSAADVESIYYTPLHVSKWREDNVCTCPASEYNGHTAPCHHAYRPPSTVTVQPPVWTAASFCHTSCLHTSRRLRLIRHSAADAGFAPRVTATEFWRSSAVADLEGSRAVHPPPLWATDSRCHSRSC